MAVITKRVRGRLYKYEEAWDPKTKRPAWKYLGPVEAEKKQDSRKSIQPRPLKARLLQAIRAAEKLTGRVYEGPEPCVVVRFYRRAGGCITRGLYKGHVRIHPLALSGEFRDHVLAHEAIHLFCPDWDEDRVERLTDRARDALAKVPAGADKKR